MLCPLEDHTKLLIFISSLQRIWYAHEHHAAQPSMEFLWITPLKLNFDVNIQHRLMEIFD